MARRGDSGSHAGAGQIAIDGEKFVHLFAEADHDSRFCNSLWINFLREPEEAEGALVACSRADDAIEARDGFGIVVEDFGAGFDDEADSFFVALEVGDEDFDLAAGGLAANFVDDHNEGAGSSDDVVVAIDAGDDGELESELSDRFGALPVEAENLLKLQAARIELGLAGARSVEFRGGRLSISGIELDSEGAAALREAVEGAVYEWREQTAALRVPDQPEARLAAVLAMAAGLRDARRSSDMLPAA